jgi:hypothetical protein
VGVFAGNEGDGAIPEHTAIVDYFENTASPNVDEDGADVVDDIPPDILNLATSPTDGSIVVLFDTNEAATGYVDYGLTANYELGTIVGAAGILQHSIQVGGLDADTVYFLRVRASDGLGNESESLVTEQTLPLGAQLGPVFDIWYGSTQTFGYPGEAQDWANILGNVSDPDGVATLTYSLNGGPLVAMGMGPDTRRLDEAGDFNADIAFAELNPGPNQLTLEATDSFGYSTIEVVTIDYDSGHVAPDNYVVDWGTASEISDVAQPVDGLWTLEGSHLRPVQLGFDRLVALGDVLWDDSEVEARITINSYEPFFLSPSNAPGVGIGVRWHGHEYKSGDSQPGTKWWPMGSIVMWRVHQNGFQEFNQWGSQGGVPDKISGSMTIGEEYVFKMRAETLPDGSHLYSYKVWPAASPEPPGWDNQLAEPASEPGQGGVLLIAHHVDASFGTVTVTPLP